LEVAVPALTTTSGLHHVTFPVSDEPSEADLARHPSMHRTDTLDCITCVIDEIYLVTDTGEVLMGPGDTVVIRGTNHAWSNRSDSPCLLVGTMVDATRPDPD
jgi:hypothetical protein